MLLGKLSVILSWKWKFSGLYRCMENTQFDSGWVHACTRKYMQSKCRAMECIREREGEEEGGREG